MSKIFRIEFIKSTQYKLFSATGLWGGVTPQGRVSVDFFVERGVTPEVLEVEVSDEGEVKETVREPSETDFTMLHRELQAGVVLAPEDAFSMGAWLMQKAVESGYSPPTGQTVED